MYKIEIIFRYKLIYCLLILITILINYLLFIVQNQFKIMILFISIFFIWFIYGLINAKWKINTNSIAFYGGGIKYVEIKYTDIINIYSYQSKLGWTCLYPIASENTVKLIYYNKKNKKIEFSFSLALDEREEFVSIVKQRMQQSNVK